MSFKFPHIIHSARVLSRNSRPHSSASSDIESGKAPGTLGRRYLSPSALSPAAALVCSGPKIPGPAASGAARRYLSSCALALTAALVCGCPKIPGRAASGVSTASGLVASAICPLPASGLRAATPLPALAAATARVTLLSRRDWICPANALRATMWRRSGIAAGLGGTAAAPAMRLGRRVPNGSWRGCEGGVRSSGISPYVVRFSPLYRSTRHCAADARYFGSSLAMISNRGSCFATARAGGRICVE